MNQPSRTRYSSSSAHLVHANFNEQIVESSSELYLIWFDSLLSLFPILREKRAI